MRNAILASILLASLAVACTTGEPNTDPATDSATVAAARADSLARAEAAEAPVLRDSAKATLASLLTDPSSASWDSLIVVRPAPVDGRVQALVVCGRIGGRPGIGGSRTPVRFVYQNRFTVFVEEEANREQFADLWSRLCRASGGTVVLQG